MRENRAKIETLNALSLKAPRFNLRCLIASGRWPSAVMSRIRATLIATSRRLSVVVLYLTNVTYMIQSSLGWEWVLGMTSRDTFTALVPKEVIEDAGYTKWENDLDGSLLVRVQATRDTIESLGIVTNVKSLGEGLFEKKWQSGLRIYFAVVEDSGRKALLLLGSGKGSEQEKAITASKRALLKYKVAKVNIAKQD